MVRASENLPLLTKPDGSPLTFYAIDGEETSTQYFDPDDAFTVVRHADGSATVFIAIVDTTLIAKKSPEYHKAARQGESYYAPSYVPMLSIPRNQEIGLKDGENRAMVTTIELDAAGTVTHISFGVARVQVQSMTHKEAAQALQAHHDDLESLSRLSKVLEDARSERTQRTGYDEKTGLYIGVEGTVRYLPEEGSLNKVHEMVREMMILGNVAVATWANEAKLPFLYRNHGPAEGGNFDVHDLATYAKNDAQREATWEAIQRFMQVPATYDFINKKHFGLGVDAYAHVTSPMRRYADMVNQKQMRFAMDVVQDVVAAYGAQVPSEKHAALETLVWEHLKDGVMPALVEAKLPKDNGFVALDASLPQALEQLEGVMAHAGLADAHALAQARDAANAQLAALHMPYVPLEMAQVGEGLNRTLSKSQDEKRAHNKLRLDSWLKKVMAAPNESILQNASTEEFTSLLERAAVTGQMNPPLHDEVVRRMELGEKLKPYKAYAGILFIAPNDAQGTGLWRDLKARVLEDLRFNGRAMQDDARELCQGALRDSRAHLFGNTAHGKRRQRVCGDAVCVDDARGGDVRARIYRDARGA